MMVWFIWFHILKATAAHQFNNRSIVVVVLATFILSTIEHKHHVKIQKLRHNF